MKPSLLKKTLVLSFAFTVPVLAVAGSEQTRPPIADCGNQLAGLKSTIWQNLEIPVCWETLATEDGQKREWVRDAVKETWEKNSAIRFVGWGQCEANSMGIRIGVADTNPHTKGLGNQLNGQREGMMLDFSFENWVPNCQTKMKHCIRNIAVHEFGHALGFAHEQNRDDAPDWCRAESQGTSGDINITPYDLHSVMNYCNPKWGGNGQLSDQDIAGLKSWYGVPTSPNSRYNGNWEGTLTYSDTTCRADKVNITVNGQQIKGKMTAADGQVIDILASVDDDSNLKDFGFSINYPSRHFVDTITLRGQLTSGTLQSTDCGCGQYFFKKQ